MLGFLTCRIILDIYIVRLSRYYEIITVPVIYYIRKKIACRGKAQVIVRLASV